MPRTTENVFEEGSAGWSGRIRGMRQISLKLELKGLWEWQWEARARPECDTWLSLAGDYATIFAKIFSLFCALHQMLTKCRCRHWRRRRRCRCRRWRWRRCLCTLFTFIEAQINKFNAPTGKKKRSKSKTRIRSSRHSRRRRRKKKENNIWQTKEEEEDSIWLLPYRHLWQSQPFTSLSHPGLAILLPPPAAGLD